MNKFAVIGCGSIGKRHIENLIYLGERSIVAYDPVEKRRSEVENRFGISTTDLLDKVWEKKPIAVLITSPTSLHVNSALEAARHGCHLFIEKPLSHTINEDTLNLLNLVKEKGLISLIGCNFRFHPGLMKVKELLSENAVGKVVSARAEFGQYLPDWHPEEDYRKNYSAKKALGGGVILDAIHEIDYIRWLLGDVESVFCLAGHLSHLEIETEDIATFLLRFRNGSFGEIHLDYIQRAYSRSCLIVGDEGTLSWNFNKGTVRWYSAKQGIWKIFAQPEEWTFSQTYLDEMRHFLFCLSGKEKPVLNAFEAHKVLEIAMAARKSSETDQMISLSAA